jgi:hypothetical protein
VATGYGSLAAVDRIDLTVQVGDGYGFSGHARV